MTKFGSSSWRFLFSMILMISMLAFSSVAEAGRRNRCRGCAARSCITTAVCKSDAASQVESPTIVLDVASQVARDSVVVHEKSKASSRVVCENGQCRLTTSVKTKSVTETQSGWQAEAQRQADLMAKRNTHGHVASAQETAFNAGASSASVFVGVGIDGQTCQGSGRLVADAVAMANGHSYHCRIWLR